MYISLSNMVINFATNIFICNNQIYSEWDKRITDNTSGKFMYSESIFPLFLRTRFVVLSRKRYSHQVVIFQPL
jgi:hypothetical protein